MSYDDEEPRMRMSIDEEDYPASKCGCGCHFIEDPAWRGQRCDFCGCVNGLHHLMRESGQRG